MARFGRAFVLDALVLAPEVDDPAPAAIRTVRRLLREFDDVGVLIVIRKGSKPPPDATRRVLKEFIEEAGDRLATVAIVLEGSGFWQAAFRALISTVVNLSRRRTRIEFFGEFAPALDALVAAVSMDEDARASVLDFLESAAPYAATEEPR